MKPDVSFLQAPKILAWQEAVTKAGCIIHSIKPLHLYHKPNGELLFAFLSVDVSAPDGNKLPSILFIRGHACIIIPLIINNDTGQKRFLMVKQRRIASGDIFLEFPAGMLDCHINNPKYVAITELFEETGFQVTENTLFPLCGSLLYSSPGASDEGIYYFGCVMTLDATTFHSLEGQLHGNTVENERIYLTLKTRDQAERQLISLQGRLGLYLFDNYCTINGLYKDDSI